MTNTEQIESLIHEYLQGTDCYLVEFKLKPTNNYKVFIDSDSGFTLEKCIKINRFLRNRIDESGMYPEGDYSIEVSSPGLDTPLKLIRQYSKNIGRKLDITFMDEEKTPLEVRLLSVEEDAIKVEPLSKIQKGRIEKNTNEPIRIEFKDIKHAVVQVEF